MRLRSLEALRGLAALSVVMAHGDASIGGNTDLPFARWHSFSFPGTAGVEFFFVLSGFVMATAHGHEIGASGRAGAFLWKRFCRIYPLYWFVLLFPLYQYWGAPALTPRAIAGWLSLLPVRTDNLLVVAWTLRQEVAFYLMFALCLAPRVGGVALGVWILGTVAWWALRPPVALGPIGSVVASHLFSIFNFEFFAGLLAGWLAQRWRGGTGLAWGMLACAVGGLAWRMSLDGWGVEYGPVWARPAYGLAYGGIILAFAALERGGGLRFSPLAAQWAMAAGAVSYPLYLSHLVTLDAVARMIGPSGAAAWLGPGGTFAVLVASATAAGWALAVAVDRPVQRVLRRVSVGSTSSRPVPE